MGAAAVGATVYFGSNKSRDQLEMVTKMFQKAHSLGMVTVLWCYLRNREFKTESGDFHFAADLTGQANYLGATIEADIIKQKMPRNNGGFKQLQFGKTDPAMYEKLTGEHPIDLTRYQVANCFMGRVGLINSGGPSGENDLVDAVKSAVINKRAGGMGIISGRKAFQKPFEKGVELLNAIQDVYSDTSISLA
jgi:class I fructose-bisphosphate aldolase